MTDRPNPTGGRVAVGPDGVLPEDVFPRPFGNYLLLKVFARGGMGEVYLARQISSGGLDRYCVVKKLRKELTRDREYVTRFIDEARVVVHLDHPNICRTFDVGRVGEEYYLAMEYVSGCDVRMVQDKARDDGVPMNADAVLPLMSELLEALDHAHHRRDQKGELLRLVHRDISPQNVMISYDGEVKLIDFGLASSKLKIEKTQPNVVMGKMAYMSPEQARGDAIDHRADLFAVGVMTYELLANERFYEGMGTHEIWQVVGRGGFAPKRWRELDPALQAIIGRALHPDHNQRFATCGAFRDALNAYLAEHYPQAGRGTVRAVVEDMFESEIAAERQVLAGFANTSINDLREDIERSRSQSVSLVEASGGSAPVALHGAGEDEDEETHVAREERGVVIAADSHENKTPPTGTHADQFASSLHPKTDVNPPRDPSELPRRKERIHDERTHLHEATEMISRANGPAPQHESTMVVRTDPTFSPYGPASVEPAKDRRSLKIVGVAAGIAILLLLGVIGWILFDRLDAPPTSQKEIATKTADTETPDTENADTENADTENAEAAPESEGVGDRPPKGVEPEAVATDDSAAPATDLKPAEVDDDRPTARRRRARQKARRDRRSKPAKPAKTATEKTTPGAGGASETKEASPAKTPAAEKVVKAPAAKPAAAPPPKRDGLTSEEMRSNAENRAKGREILAQKGYPFGEMYPVALKLFAEPKPGESPNAGKEFLRRARRQPAMNVVVNYLRDNCKQKKCWDVVVKRLVDFRKDESNRALGKSFATALHSCREQCKVK